MRMLLFSLRALCVLLLSFQAVATALDEANATVTPEEKYHQFTLQIEDFFKKNVKSVMKSLLPNMMSLQGDSQISGRCMQSLTKYVMGLNKAKMWATQMLDATSKVPSGFLIGTFADYGSFDECLDVRVFKRDGGLDFQGSSCALEVKPPMPPPERKASLAGAKLAEGHESLAVGLQKAQLSISQKWVKLTACVPSTCTLEDVRLLANTIVNETEFNFKVKVPACYTSKGTEFSAIQIAVLSILAILLVLGVSGSVYEGWKAYSGEKISGLGEKMLTSFSLTTNFERLVTVSGGSDEFKCLHGIRVLSTMWVILAHIYIYTDYQTLKDPINVQRWFATLPFELVHNGWLTVDAFFLMSGMLASYGGLKGMAKTKGSLDIPRLIFRRYLRLTPPVLLVMGMFFCLPLLASGPFWYDHVGRPLEDCKKYWWTNLLHFFNWWGINKGCIETSWYVAADIQLYILSLFILLILYRYSKAGIGSILACILISCVAIVFQTWYWDLPASVQLSTGDKRQVYETIDKIHIQTLTHLGPYCIGMALGYYILKYKNRKLSKPVVIAGWCFSVIVCLTAVLGNHRFSTGEETSEALLIFYAAIHRCVYTCGVAWVILACILGYGGPVNSLLSSTIMVPISKLTFMIYLVHPLVLWMKIGSMRERLYASHYEFVYSFIANTMVSIFVAVPLHLLLEAPLANIERLLLGGTKKKDNGNHQAAPTETQQVTLPETKPSISLWKIPSRKSFTLNS